MNKIKIISIATALLFLNACEAKESTYINIMLERVDDPLADVIIKHKECMTEMSEGSFKTFKEQAEGDPTGMESANKVSECPTPYDALCESNFGKNYYYSNVKHILDKGKVECGQLGGKWTASNTRKIKDAK